MIQPPSTYESQRAACIRYDVEPDSAQKDDSTPTMRPTSRNAAERKRACLVRPHTDAELAELFGVARSTV